jgi:hypothetical protein
MDTPALAPAASPLQFETAEPATGADAAKQCAACKAAIDNAYHLANGKVICARCRDSVVGAQEASARGRLGRALLYGSGAALLGGALYYAVVAITEMQLALVAIAVGFLVGRAVHRATGGFGGRGYQVLAVLLTYLAIAGSFVPQVLAQGQTDGHAFSFTVAVITSLMLPVLVVADSPIITLIIGIGLWQAWKQTRGTQLEVTGPYFLRPVQTTVLEAAPNGD